MSVQRQARSSRPRVVHSDTRVYQPTPTLGRCESGGCTRAARTICVECEGEFCLAHAVHPEHRADDRR